MAACDTNELLIAARCFSCLPFSTLLEIQTYLLCQLLSAGGTGGSGAMSGPADPVAAPIGSSAFYLNTTTNSFWAWNSVSASWVPLVV